MKISELFNSKKPVISFEVFPPKPEFPIDTVFNTIDSLKSLSPDFISVTYGAGGSNRSRMIEIASRVKNFFGIETLSHLTCAASTTADINNILEYLKNENIENILALRGDIPKDIKDYDFCNQEFSHASDLIPYIKKTSNFCIGAACYPESHIESIDRKDDVEKLKLKVDAGVDFLVSQLFYSNKIFYTFLEDIRRIGIQCPVSAGIMPVFNINQIKRMTLMCGVRIPKKLILILNRFENNPEDLLKAGIDYAVEQINDLIANGVDGIHLYTMNKSEQVRKIVESIKNNNLGD